MDKNWYQSKAMWGAIFLAVVAIANAAGIAIPNEVYGLAAALGIYGLRAAMK